LETTGKYNRFIDVVKKVIKMLMKSKSATVRDHQHKNYSKSGRYSWAQYFAISISRSGRKIQRNTSWTQRRNVIDLLML
jgi:hypothetical protein